MKCRQARRHLTAYATQELSPELAQAVTEHLATCARCAKEASEHAAIWGLIRRPASLTPAPGFNAAVWGRVRQRQRSWPFSLALRPQQLLAPVAVAAVIAIGGWLGVRSQSTRALRPSSLPVENAPKQLASAFDDFPEGSVGEAFVTLASAKTPATERGVAPR